MLRNGQRLSDFRRKNLNSLKIILVIASVLLMAIPEEVLASVTDPAYDLRTVSKVTSV